VLKAQGSKLRADKKEENEWQTLPKDARGRKKHQGMTKQELQKKFADSKSKHGMFGFPFYTRLATWMLLM
jgi:hypothetical protein